MKKIILLIITLVCLSLNSEEIVKTKDGKEIILYDDHTWIENKKVDNDYEKYLSQLRSGISASAQERVIACEMLSQGWKYTMPRPKSAQASWGNSDGRTTWWNGYWYNSQTDLYSNATPQKKVSGLYLGDNQNTSGSWKNGGSPARPDVYMFLLSSFGGPSN